MQLSKAEPPALNPEFYFAIIETMLLAFADGCILKSHCYYLGKKLIEGFFFLYVDIIFSNSHLFILKNCILWGFVAILLWYECLWYYLLFISFPSKCIWENEWQAL